MVVSMQFSGAGVLCWVLLVRREWAGRLFQF